MASVRMALFFTAVVLSGAAVRAQDVPVIRSETRLVLVDAVVTDKKGNYIHDLKAEDFRLWEDGKEQKILNCTLQAESAAAAQQRYVLFVFDSASLSSTDVLRVREAAARFVDANAGPKRLMAVAHGTESGNVGLAQNFTADTQRLHQAIAAIRPSGSGSRMQGGRGGEAPRPTDAMRSNRQAGAGALIQNTFANLAGLAKRLNSLPGRKTVVLFTGGFDVPAANSPAMEAMIDACNRSNVAIYPLDVGGLEGSSLGASESGRRDRLNFVPSKSPLVMPFQSGQTGGQGQTGGSTGARTSTAPPAVTPPPNIPLGFDTSTSRRGLLSDIARQTGGFMVTGSNDLLGAVDKIGKEQEEYYMLSYSAPFSQDGSCHSLKVKVNRGGTVVRARSRYCNVRSPDLLAGTPVVRQLEARLADSAPGNAAGSMKAPYFYAENNTARVNVAMEFPSKAVSFAKEKGKMRGAVNVLGVAYRPDGAVAARFSDGVKLELDNKQQETFQQRPFHYENQFEMAPGQYTLKLAFNSGGDAFGRMEAPLVIESYDGQKLGLAALALSNDIRRVPPEGLGAALMEDRTPLVTRGLLMIPSGTNRFKTSDNAAVYTEVYDPLLTGANPPDVGVVIRILDRKTGQQKQNSGLVKVSGPGASDGNKVPVGLTLPLKDLGPGAYTVEVTAHDSAGNKTPPRTVELDIE